MRTKMEILAKYHEHEITAWRHIYVPEPYQSGPTDPDQDAFWRDYWHDLGTYRGRW
jgi:hypothetical protein